MYRESDPIWIDRGTESSTGATQSRERDSRTWSDTGLGKHTNIVLVKGVNQDTAVQSSNN